MVRQPGPILLLGGSRHRVHQRPRPPTGSPATPPLRDEELTFVAGDGTSAPLGFGTEGARHGEARRRARRDEPLAAASSRLQATRHPARTVCWRGHATCFRACVRCLARSAPRRCRVRLRGETARRPTAPSCHGPRPRARRRVRPALRGLPGHAPRRLRSRRAPALASVVRREPCARPLRVRAHLPPRSEGAVTPPECAPVPLFRAWTWR